MFNKKDVPGPLSIHFRHPAMLASDIEVGEKVSHNARDERFKGLVEAVLLKVESAFSMHHPTHVANTVWAKSEGRCWHHQTV